MRAITVRDRDAGAGGLSLTDMPYPHAAGNDVIVRVHAAGFTSGELDWSSTWTDRAGRDRTPSVPGHDLSGVVAELGYGTTGLTVEEDSPPAFRPDFRRGSGGDERARLADLAGRVRHGRLKPIVGAIRTLPEAPAAFAPDGRTRGKTIIQVTGG